MKRSTDSVKSAPLPVIELETQKEIDDFRAAIMDFSRSVNQDIRHEVGFDPKHFVLIIRKFEESVTECDEDLEKFWFSALIKVGENGKVGMLTDKKTRKVRKGRGTARKWLRYSI